MMPTSEANPPTSPSPPVATKPGAGDRSRGTWWLIPIVLLAGLGAWLAGERLLGSFAPSAQETAGGGFGMADNAAYLRGLRRVAAYDATLHYGVAGLIVGLAAGLAGGLARRSVGGTILGVVVGAGAGAAGAAGVAFVLAPVFLDLYRQDEPNLLLPIMLHGGVWIVVGLAMGLAFAVGRGGTTPRLATLAGGALGAALGMIAFEVLYSVAFPLARGESPVPSESSARLLGHLLIPTAAAMGIVLSLRTRGRSVMPEPTHL